MQLIFNTYGWQKNEVLVYMTTTFRVLLYIAYIPKFLQGRQRAYIWMFYIMLSFLLMKTRQILAISYGSILTCLCDHTHSISKRY